MQVEGPPPRVDAAARGRIEKTVTGLSIVAALGWWPYMITWWMRHGWPPYPETYFVGLVAIPAAILGAGRLIVLGVRAWRAG